MEHPPPDLARGMLSRADAPRIAGYCTTMSASAMAAYLCGILRYGVGAQASSMAFLSLSGAQLLHAITARSRTAGPFSGASLPQNPLIGAGVLAGFGLLALSQLVPGLGGLLGTARIGILDSLCCVGAAVASFLINEAPKMQERTHRQIEEEVPNVYNGK